MDDTRRKLQKSLRQKAAKVGAQKSHVEMAAIVTDTLIAIKRYKKQRRKQIWDDFWHNFNEQPRLLF